MNQSATISLRHKLPQGMSIERGENQKNVNRNILQFLINKYDRQQALKVLDLPCGKLTFLGYVRDLFPNASLTGADIVVPVMRKGIDFIPMDLTREFAIPRSEQYDLITSIAGVMMFSNTLSFIENCTSRLKQGGTIIITNDNSATVIDRMSYMFLGRFRMFKPVYEDTETLTNFVPIQELIRLLRIHNIEIEKIEYTSFYAKDLKYLPIALLVYPFQLLYLLMYRTRLPGELKWKKYTFKHLFCKAYYIVGMKMPGRAQVFDTSSATKSTSLSV